MTGNNLIIANSGDAARVDDYKSDLADGEVVVQAIYSARVGRADAAANRLPRRVPSAYRVPKAGLRLLMADPLGAWLAARLKETDGWIGENACCTSTPPTWQALALALWGAGAGEIGLFRPGDYMEAMRGVGVRLSDAGRMAMAKWWAKPAALRLVDRVGQWRGRWGNSYFRLVAETVDHEIWESMHGNRIATINVIRPGRGGVDAMDWPTGWYNQDGVVHEEQLVLWYGEKFVGFSRIEAR